MAAARKTTAATRKPADEPPATEPQTEPQDTAADETTPKAEDTEPKEPAEPDEPETAGGEDGTPERSDLQDGLCQECFPNGWPAQAFAVGCTHGTWAREGS
ncbi:hypothetical protein AB0N17_02945 [Streptomyces sp. NPDC051133]|uniref:hypothetical protein n=1 Tax=Streptomyces sp. NPDC051133 TaxID=3155521 RepID=UPI00343787A2